ncbi:hypothetical protein O6471_24835, partial [Salmonella enterica subsp. enterica]
MAPKPLIQVFPRQWPSQVGEQATGQAVFTLSEIDRLTRARHRQFGIIKGQVVETLHLISRWLLQP